MSLGLDQVFPQPRSRRLRDPWPRVRRSPGPPLRRSRVRWWRVLSVLGAAGLVLALLGLLVWRWGADHSPFARLLPADTPMVIEGEPSAVLMALRSLPGPGPELLKDFGLFPATLSESDRVLVALLAGPPLAHPNPCRTHLAQTVDRLESSWEKTGSWPEHLAEVAPCPQGGKTFYRRQGEDYVLECRGDDHRLAYDSRQGFIEELTPSPVYLVAIENSTGQTVQAGLMPGTGPDLRLFCSDPDQLDRLLSASGHRLSLPGPEDSPLRLTARVRELCELFPDLPSGLARNDRIEAWGDLDAGRISARMPLPSSVPPDESVEVTRLLAELPASPVALAGTPSFLRLLGLDPSPTEAPELLGLSLATPLTRGQEREQLARALKGRQPAALEARFADATRARVWLDSSSWASLQGEGHRGGEAACLQERVLIHTGPGISLEESRPALPDGPGQTGLAGWTTIQDPEAGTKVYSIAAGRDGATFWLEILRQGNSANSPGPQPSPSVPTMQGSW